MFECLNKCSGLFSLFAALASVIVPLWIYRKQKKEHLQDLKDELEAMEDNSVFPIGHDDRELFTHKSSLQKKLRRK